VTYQKLLTKERHHTTTYQNQFTSSIEKWEKSQFIEADPSPTVVARSKSSSTIKIIKKNLDTAALFWYHPYALPE